jgi:hypothetical protein
MTISDSNAVLTTINNATYWKAVTIGRDKDDIALFRSHMWEVLFPYSTVEVQDPIDSFKESKMLAASAKVLHQSYSLASYEVVYLVYYSLCVTFHVAGPGLSSWSAVMMTEWTLKSVDIRILCGVLRGRNLSNRDSLY